ncbi:MAG: histidine phosphatase family protein [Hyphomicrobiaceae bacterium]|nr:histidine phosphatase family protein [Hyphomicrobiaceae bacterium]
MLTLSLLRHAKSDWSAPGLDDFDRPLAARGREAAPRMAAFMAREGIRPRLILCSAAVRTRQTLELVLPMLGGEPEVSIEKGLYLAPASLMLARLGKVPAGIAHVMMVGHDPGMHELAVALAGTGDAQSLKALAAKFPTAALAVIQLDAKAWSEIAPGKGRLVRFMTPRALD